MWEYHVFHERAPYTAEEQEACIARLNALGEEGWELVDALTVRQGVSIFYFFKRERG